MSDKNEHAIGNARGWSETIAALVGALEVDYDRLEELQAMDAADMGEDEKIELEELVAMATVDGDLFEDADAVRERIQESPLSVEVRSDWRAPGDDDGDPVEFQILLSTGGPALRIMGELDEHKQPHRAWLEWQDWGTPWTHHYEDGFAPVLLKFCEQFYFGE
jgi:hypothetical protein